MLNFKVKVTKLKYLMAKSLFQSQTTQYLIQCIYIAPTESSQGTLHKRVQTYTERNPTIPHEQALGDRGEEQLPLMEEISSTRLGVGGRIWLMGEI